jgi:K+-sensing histidine kinase KdpD
MSSRHSSHAPARVPTPTDELHTSLTRGTAAFDNAAPLARRFKPKRDAITRVRHDLRSIVHAMLGYSDLLVEPHYGTLSADQQRFVEHLRSAAEHVQELVDTCIELSRAPGDVRTIELPVVQLDLVLRRVASALESAGISCDMEIAPAHLGRQLALDLTGFERALTGLAMVASREGAVCCALRTHELQGRMYLRLRASDAAEATPFALLDTLEDQIGNRDFVRLKLSEVLLSRQRIALRLAPTLDTFDLELT